MLIILSPAKTMNMKKTDISVPESKPKYVKEAEFLAEKMQYYSILRIILKNKRYWLTTAVCSGK